tara:strand:- start:136 stop:510 length:375 start_codon:yes stop_codon:yes gene_type:complete
MKNWKPFIKYNNKFLDNISWFFKVGGISLFPIVVLRERYKNQELEYGLQRIVTHETIHFQQQLEMLVIPFYIIYILEYVIKALYYFNIEKAYRNISFEREAYQYELDKNYLERRKRYNWVKLIF